MTDYTFDGAQDLIIDDFIFADDTLIFNLPASEVATVFAVGDAVVITTTSGATLTMAGVTLSDFATGQIAMQPAADFIVVGSNAADTLSVESAGSVVTALEGNDSVIGSGGGDVLFGNQGDDIIFGNGGDDRLYGGQGDDSISFGYGGPTLLRAPLNEQVLVVGGMGRDVIEGQVTGSATIYGGSETGQPGDGSDDIYLWLTPGAQVSIMADAGNDYISVMGDSMASETSALIDAGAGNDRIYGDYSGATGIIGGLGSDEVYIYATGQVVVLGGTDLADARDGADMINIDLGRGEGESESMSSATIFGNAGNDQITVSSEGPALVYAHGGKGTDIIRAWGLGEGSEISGGVGSDQIETFVAEGGTTIYGGGGKSSAEDGTDFIFSNVAAGASVTVYGNGGDDMIVVDGQGDAIIRGGKGGDTLSADGEGRFVLTGGTDADTFIFNTASTTAATLSKITDLNFDEDFVGSNASIETLVEVTGLADSFDDLILLASPDTLEGDEATLITIEDGEYAGSYLAYERDGESLQIVDVTGYTGDVDVGIFVPSTGYLIG